MKYILLYSFQFVLFLNIAIAQNLIKEIKKSHENGKPKQIDYLETENLKKVRTDLFNQYGQKVFSMKFNPVNGLANGEFFDLVNKGYFENGQLNCEKCILIEGNKPSVFSQVNFDGKYSYKIIHEEVVTPAIFGTVKKRTFYW